MSKRLLWISVGLIVLGSTPQAITRIDQGTRLYLKLAINHISTSQTSDGEEIGDSNSFAVRSNETTEIWIFDPNPLVFKYEVTTTTSDTEDYKAARAFANELGALLGRFPGSSAAGLKLKPTVEGLDLMAFKDSLMTLQTYLNSVGDWIDRSFDVKQTDPTNPSGAQAMKEKVNACKLSETADHVEAGYAKLITIWTKCMSGAPLTDQDNQPVSCDGPFDITPQVLERQLTAELDLANARVAAAVEAKEKADGAVRSAKAKVAKRQNELHNAKTANDIKTAQILLDVAKVEADSALAAQASAPNAIVEAKADVETTTASLNNARTDVADAHAAAASGQTIRTFVIGALATEAHGMAAATTLRAFAKDVDALLKPRKLDARPYSLQLQKIAVAVKAETRYENFLSAGAKQKRAAALTTINLTLQPYSAASLRPGVGFVLGFLRNPTFSTVKSGDAYQIVQNDTGLTRYSVAAMLNIIPAGWDQPTFGGYFQIGVSPKNDETGFFFGAGISVQSLLTFGGGLMIQQVRELGPGLSLSNPIARPEDLKTQTVFKPAFYLHATVTLKK